ncbi:hypothetical protein KS4_05420 [Poriferisphaera corsica]|uniref:Uncharacterized protein n=1 Tax=Poriferisphaera corsica TaxID=2528020 RepID=A0A517YQL8_9BACT|nr:hypothetical protein [Poriferisphaera corsica]QDU32510.1 hypothetical protein KS4_05420 [Poriferisphaera corsica]
MRKQSKAIIFLVSYFICISLVQFAAARMMPSPNVIERIEHAKTLIAILDMNAHLITADERERLLINNGVYSDWATVGMRK